MRGNLDSRIRGFLSRQTTVERPEGLCNRIVLRQLSVEGTGGREVTSFSLDHVPSSSELESLIQEICSTAQGDADGLGRHVQKYAIFTYFEQSISSLGSFPFMLSGEGADGDDDGFEGSEPANAKGLLAQLMRHNEGNARTSTLAMGGVVREQARIIEKITERNEKLNEKLIEVSELMEALQSAKHERDLESRRLEHKLKVTDEMFERVRILLPVVANKIMGKTVFPESVDPRVMIVKEWAESLTTKQVDALKNVLGPEQMIGLLEAVEKTQEDKFERPIGKLASVSNVDGKREETSMTTTTTTTPKKK